MTRSTRKPRPRLASAALLLSAVAFAAAAPTARAGDTPMSPQDAEKLEAKLVELARHATPRTVMVQGLIGLGTGAVIDGGGTVVTNAHVAAGARYAILLHPDGRRELARRQGIDYERDLAVLRPVRRSAEEVPHFELRSERPAPGTWVAALGYPGGPRGDARPTFTVGRVIEGSATTNVNGFLNYAGAIRVDAPIYSGNSGGPLVDLEGRLVGINGAVELAGAAVGGLSIPTKTMVERTRGLQGGIVRLPGGMELDPQKSTLVRLLEDRLDAWVKERMEAQLQASRQRRRPSTARSAPFGLSAGVHLGREALERRTRAVEAFLKRAQGPSGTLLVPLRAKATKTPGALRLRGASGRTGYGAAIRGLGVLACASRFEDDAAELRDAQGRVYVVTAYSRPLDLLLLRSPEGAAPTPAPPVTRARPVGTLVLVSGEDGPVAAGVLSAGGRSIPPSAVALQGGPGMGDLIRPLVERMIQAAKAFGQEEVAELGNQILKALELRDAFSHGSPLRTYRRVLSIDAPVSPRMAGAPVLDRTGRVVGVLVANAHFGTSYAVPIDAIQLAFGEGGDATRGRAAQHRSRTPRASRTSDAGRGPAPEAPRRTRRARGDLAPF